VIAVDTNILVCAHRSEFRQHETAPAALTVHLPLEHGVREILTEDRDFQRFDEITTRRL